jgi:hypothetical protein
MNSDGAAILLAAILRHTGLPRRGLRKAAHNPIGGLRLAVIDAGSSGAPARLHGGGAKKHRAVRDPGWCCRAEKKQSLEKKPSSGCVRKERMPPDAIALSAKAS